jgi:methyltransferase (TIGR00027 family)
MSEAPPAPAHEASRSRRGAVPAAFVAAEFRAEENAQPQPLYRDPLVAIFLGAATREAAAHAASVNPASSKVVRLRTRHMDDTLERQLALGCRQVVLLGAGLDTRAMRKRSEGVTYFEVDEPSIVGFKRDRLKTIGIDVDVTRIVGNPVHDDWIGKLEAVGFDVARPTHVIWEGHTMHVPMAKVIEALRDVRDRIPRATISFDYLARDLVEKTTGDPALSVLAFRSESLGVPWITGITDVRELALHLDYALLDDVSIAELHHLHWPSRRTGSALLSHHSVCTLASRGGATGA